MDVIAYAVRHIKQELPGELISWLPYLFFPEIIAVLSFCRATICGLTAIPIYIWALFWHSNGRSILDMLQNPQGNGRLIRYNNDSNRCRWRERSHPVPQWAQRTHLCRIRIRISNDPDLLPIKGYDSRLCMFSYYQIHPMSIDKTAGGPSSEHGVTANVSETTSHQSIRSGYFLSFSIKLLRKARPKHPQCGFISLFLVFIATIFGLLSIIACHRIYAHSGSSVQALFVLPREALLAFPREQLSFPREQTHLALRHH